MTYKQTLEYLYSQLPMFQRNGASAYKANLDNTIAICNLVNNPQEKFKTIHIAGTNGKGSTSHMLAAILQTAGYKVGLYTSPHLKDFRERIKINGKKINKRFIIDFIKKHKDSIEKIQPSFFEATVGLAFDYFEKGKIDIGIIETGLGGRLDSTNIIRPELSLITNIGLDHIDLLGDTIEKITFEKAGIIKRNIPVVISETQLKTYPLFVQKAKEENAPILFADTHFKVDHIITSNKIKPFLVFNVYYNDILFYKNLHLDLIGNYQLKNIAGVLQTVEVLKTKGFSIRKEDIESALKNIKKRTGLLGRWHILNKQPLTICDTGHNIDGIRQVVNQINTTPHKRLHFVLGVVKDKDVSEIFNLLPKDASYYFCKADLPRSLDQNELKRIALEHGLKGKPYPSVAKALHAAQQKATNQDLIFIGGSTFVVAEVL